MKKVIGGRRYDTNTAKKCGEYEYSNRTDFNWEHEILFRKQTGEYFLFGEGGPQSGYSKTIGQNQWSGGKAIHPLSLKEAQEWAEKHLDGDDYEAIFGKVEETGDKVTVAVRLSPAAIARLNDLAAERAIPKSEIIEKMLLRE